ncbi:MAG: tRNA dihydrouridine(20/20a) synthase DusA [Spirochaetes bacterium GWB1_48_6]|nr:MAG: tRNA dihydrouridine(20/20a) synthase DusA [Spirochaetes bacterium GWB1_48_6]
MTYFPVSVAPMVDRTDRHFRHFLRLLAPKTILYTEMVTSPAIIHGPRDYLLGYSPVEHPLVLQLAGDDPEELRRVVEIADPWNYDEINLNCGCPSDKVQEAHFGACLMAEPKLVASVVKAMTQGTSKPITVKHRIGIRGKETYEEMRDFALACSDAGASRLIIHARIAILEGLSPKENRTVPPLRYEDVYRLKQEHPELKIEINGGILTPEDVVAHLKYVDGVMIGRAAYDNPYVLTKIERALTGEPLEHITRRWILEQMIPYVEEWEGKDVWWHRIMMHLHGLFAFHKGTKKWKQILSPPFKKFASGVDAIKLALDTLPAEVLDSRE